ncbi:CLUMA_CG002598, isoform A [Clunio marinus]|uniref:CLUMA_CG002598, isoform A n=1 Tax=Clunio marinus TaxID=568069 RepID=A0A1J1HMH3_9DIPT|nr:CLUMA_CG002598, isoform A [Clunio marinus]
MSVTVMLNNITELLAKADDHDHDHDHEHDDLSEVNMAKFITMAVLFILSMGSGMIPLLLTKWLDWSDPNRDPRTNLLVSSLLSFGGGALLCTTFLHLVPEIDEIIGALQHDGRIPEWDFSITNLLMAVGFFIIYFVEEIVHAYLRRQQKKQVEAQEAFIRGHSPRDSLHDAAKRRELEKKAAAEATGNGVMTVSTADLVDNEHVDNNHHTHSHNHHHHSHIPVFNGDDSLLVSSIRGLLIVMALSVHEVFEGLAVGLEDTTSNVWYMFGSISAHKVVIAFCIGVELMVHKTKTWLLVLYIFIYAIVSPLGIGIGIILSNGDDPEAFDVASVILQGLASGTLLYVIFFEILSKHKDGIIQFLAVVFGFFLMFGLKFIGGHSHSHHDDHDH